MTWIRFHSRQRIFTIFQMKVRRIYSIEQKQVSSNTMLKTRTMYRPSMKAQKSAFHSPLSSSLLWRLWTNSNRSQKFRRPILQWRQISGIIHFPISKWEPRLRASRKLIRLNRSTKRLRWINLSAWKLLFRLLMYI